MAMVIATPSPPTGVRAELSAGAIPDIGVFRVSGAALAPARGLLIGLALSLTIWTVVGAAFLLMRL